MLLDCERKRKNSMKSIVNKGREKVVTKEKRRRMGKRNEKAENFFWTKEGVLSI